ncbi:hypothetical protein [Paenibacillus monticola]|uniref:Uncharacterized protein n=1 Tax=Paenibacillus monticola TaxID=2666075 RepID=A0A7X2H8K1_9BACL|nr:hypothetical protein [Paenibacillus monticola]MRN55486.1 hypothetical protein [Paenibacillus monticola]
MNKKYQLPVLFVASALLIIISTLIPSEKSTWLGVLQTLLLGIGLLGGCRAFWRFIHGGKKKG